MKNNFKISLFPGENRKTQKALVENQRKIQGYNSRLTEFSSFEIAYETEGLIQSVARAGHTTKILLEIRIAVRTKRREKRKEKPFTSRDETINGHTTGMTEFHSDFREYFTRSEKGLNRTHGYTTMSSHREKRLSWHSIVLESFRALPQLEQSVTPTDKGECV